MWYFSNNFKSDPGVSPRGQAAKDADEIFHDTDTVLDRNSEITVLWSKGLTGQSRHLTAESASQVACTPSCMFSDLYSDGAEVGRGSFGIVKSSRHLKSDTPCVVKSCCKAVVGEAYIENFVKKDMYSRQLKISTEPFRHPNVILFLDFMMGPTMLYVVMEALHGPELFNYLKMHAPVTTMFCWRSMRQLFSALEHIHTLGIIHRDVKPEAFRFRDDTLHSDLVLIDFGMCCFAEDSSQRRAAVGTAAYVAPEIFEHIYDTQVDLWSAGVILYILVTGRLPFQQQEEGTIPKPATQQGVRIALHTTKMHYVPHVAIELLNSLLCIDPKHRYSAAQAREYMLKRLMLDGGETRKHIEVEKAAYADAERAGGHSAVVNHPCGGPRIRDTQRVDKNSRCFTVIEDELEAESPRRANGAHLSTSEGSFASTLRTQDSQDAFSTKGKSDSLVLLPTELLREQLETRSALYTGSTEILREEFERAEQFYQSVTPGSSPIRSGAPTQQQLPSGALRFTVQLPASRLQSREKVVVSELFHISQLGVSVPFRIQALATKVHDKRHGHCFRKAKGCGQLELKCEGTPPTCWPPLSFRFGVGRGADSSQLSAAATHDFRYSCIGCLAPGHNTWDFQSHVKPGSGTFTVNVVVEAHPVMVDAFSQE